MSEFKCPKCGSTECESVTYDVNHGSHIQTCGSHQVRCRGSFEDGRLCAWLGTWPLENAPTVDGPKYLEGGEQVEVLAEFGNQCVVVMLYEPEYEDDGPRLGEPFIIAKSKVFDSVLVSKKEQEITRIEKRIAELTEERKKLDSIINTKSKEITELRHSYMDVEKATQENAAMRRVWNLITGKIKYLVFNNSYSCEIIPIEQATSKHGCRGEIRLLSLFGDSNGKLDWKLNDYDNGHGGREETVVPCLTIAEAREVAEPLVKRHLEEAMRDSYKSVESLERAIQQSMNASFTPDAKYADELAARKKKKSDEKIAAAEEQLAKAREAATKG